MLPGPGTREQSQEELEQGEEQLPVAVAHRGNKVTVARATVTRLHKLGCVGVVGWSHVDEATCREVVED